MDLQSLFERVVDLEPTDAEAELEALCPTNPGLRAEVLAMVRADAGSQPLLDDGPMRAIAAGAPIQPGTRIGEYRIVRLLGEGGMGAVYLAEREEGFEQRVALKVIGGWVAPEALLSRFEAERQILASLDHPNIARLLGGGATENGQPYFTMEYVDGEPLTEACARRNATLDERLRLFCRVCEAVVHAQQNLVIHRDLKPSNVLVTADGTPKLLDFGIAKVLDTGRGDGEQITQAGQNVLTPGYSAPEQITGGAITTATDVFSLGVLLYELLTGVTPFDASTAAGRNEAVLERTPGRPSAVAPDASAAELRGDLDLIVATAIAKASEERYASAAALLGDVRRYMDGFPILARPPTVGYRVQKFVRRHTIATAAVLVLVLLSIGFATYHTSRLSQERDRARLEAAKASAVADFMTTLFAVSDPRTTGGETVTAREVLGRGAARIDRELKDQPEIRAALLESIGRAERGLGLFEPATAHLEEALTLKKKHAPPAQLAAAHLHLGEALADRARYDEAEQHLRAALALAATAEHHRALGAMLTAAGRFDEAEAPLVLAVELHREARAPQLGQTLVDLGLLFHEMNRHAEAEKAYREALALLRATHTKPHPEVSNALYHLGQLLRDDARWQESLPLHEETLAMDRALYGDEHPVVAASMTNLGMLLVQMDRLDDAEPYVMGALEMRRKLLEPAHPDIGRSLTRAARLMHDRGELAEAERLYREALAHQKASLPSEHPLIAGRMNNLSWILHDRGRFEEAAEWAEKGLALNLQARSEGSMAVAISRMHLARALHGLGRLERAEAAIRASLATGLELYGEAHPFSASARRTLAQVLLDAGRLEEAETEAERAVAALKGVVDEGHSRTALARETLEAVRAARAAQSRGSTQ